MGHDVELHRGGPARHRVGDRGIEAQREVGGRGHRKGKAGVLGGVGRGNPHAQRVGPRLHRIGYGQVECDVVGVAGVGGHADGGGVEGEARGCGRTVGRLERKADVPVEVDLEGELQIGRARGPHLDGDGVGAHAGGELRRRLHRECKRHAAFETAQGPLEKQVIAARDHARVHRERERVGTARNGHGGRLQGQACGGGTAVRAHEHQRQVPAHPHRVHEQRRRRGPSLRGVELGARQRQLEPADRHGEVGVVGHAAPRHLEPQRVGTRPHVTGYLD